MHANDQIRLTSVWCLWCGSTVVGWNVYEIPNGISRVSLAHSLLLLLLRLLLLLLLVSLPSFCFRSHHPFVCSHILNLLTGFRTLPVAYTQLTRCLDHRVPLFCRFYFSLVLHSLHSHLFFSVIYLYVFGSFVCTQKTLRTI